MMLRILFKSGILILFLFIFSFSNDGYKNQEVTADELKMHVSYLASEQLEGRLTGSDGDSLAAEYIRSDLKGMGFLPLYSNGFQYFSVTDKIVSGPANSLMVNAELLKLDIDFAPFAFSDNQTFSAEVVFAGYGFDIGEDSLKWNDYDSIDVKGKIVMLLRADPEIEKLVSPFMKYSKDRDKALQAKDKGAVAVFLVSGKTYDAEDKFELLTKGDQSVGIPVFRISRTVANRILEPRGQTIENLEIKINESHKPVVIATAVKVRGHSDVIQTNKPTRNVVMILPGSDDKLKNEYLVLGAHFDHLGWGGQGSGSRIPDTTAIHYGADDNASGVAMLLELAEKLAFHRADLKRSIVIAAFSGEEMGLLGSKYFVENPAFDFSKINAMLNFDMVGRLNENSLLQIGGVGTSPLFREKILTDCDTSIIKLALSDEGYGPSDHASFYGKDIPVLFFSTGAHLDYHTPGDTFDKINYEGMVGVADLCYSLIVDLANSDNKLEFREAGPKFVAGRGTRRKGISLGIMPDFAGNVKNGLRADQVTPGRPAQIGGMKRGDIITSINGKPVNNIQDYMFRLNQLKAGETINVEVLRNGKTEVLIVQL